MRDVSAFSRMFVAAALIGSLCLFAGTRTGGAAEPVAAPKAPEPYAPGLGDFMTAYVQPHHIKLWLAGREKNWPLADYEAKELKETFEDVVTYQGVWHDFPIGKMVETILEPPLTAVDEAIKARDEDRFKQAYDRLTAGCNACHQATQNEFLVIKVPPGPAFTDQQFTPR